MGIYDREYYRNEAQARMHRLQNFQSWRWWSITTWLIIINVAVFLLNELTRKELFLPIGYFSTQTAVFQLQVWRFITYQFLHANLWHILFNMIALYFFGQMIEQYLGSWRYLVFYLACGIAGALLFVLFTLTQIIPTPVTAPMIGASAGVFGVLIGAARLAPDRTVQMMLFPFFVPMKLKVLAWILIGMAVYTVITTGQNVGGEVAHLGGGGFGFLLIKNVHWLYFLDRFSPEKLQVWWNRGTWKRREKQRDHMREEVDRILEKIIREGIGSLSKRERETLHRAAEELK
ncbi:Rhomboid protease GluP [Planctomycetes bacterium Pan216]|uniref:Rhomboid protease GluP n=1 Tax=Kolteria novifilia TaxID=2527975 RepID=A0A518B0X9_9BACT|nr:Rhomboid protease GluP [Planctomycetes bacterium Pan216]